MLTEMTSGPTETAPLHNPAQALTETPPEPTQTRPTDHDPALELQAHIEAIANMLTELSVAAETAGVDPNTIKVAFVRGRLAGVTSQQMARALSTYRSVGGPAGLALRVFGLGGIPKEELPVAFAAFNKAFLDLKMSPPQGEEFGKFMLSSGMQFMIEQAIAFGNNATDGLAAIEARNRSLSSGLDSSPAATSQK